MWTYVIRRLLYAIPILIGVLLLTFAIFYTIQTPEDMSRARVLQKGGTENDVAADLRGQGYAELNEHGVLKLAILNEVAEGKINAEKDLDTLVRRVDGLTYGKKRSEEVDREFENEKEQQAFEKIHGAGVKPKKTVIHFDETKIVGAELLESVRQSLIAAQEEHLADEARTATPKSQELKDLIAATAAAQSAVDADEKAAKAFAAKEEGAVDPDAVQVAANKSALEVAKKASDEALKVYNDQIAATIKPALDAFKPTDKALFQGLLEADQMRIGTNETRRFSTVENFFNYIFDLFTFNFRKTNDKRYVSDVLIGGMGPSLMLMLPAFIISELLGIFFGLFAALFRGTKIDRSLVIFSVLFMSVTPVAFIIFAQKFFASDWQYFPISGYEPGLAGFSYLALPIMIYVMISIGALVRFNRIVMLDEVGQDYVRTAKAKGLSRNNMLFKHVLRNALVPLITRWAVAIPNLYLGSLLLESFFAIPGLGGITVQAVLNTDINQIRALVFIGTIIYILSTLLSDVLYAVVDPRVKLS